MDGLTLLAEARAAGLAVRAEAGRLVIDGPRSAAALAERLIAAKPAVLAALGAEQGGPGVWWDDRVPEGTARIIALPPRGCRFPIACARLGPCARHAVGGGCSVAGTTEGARDAGT